MDKLNDLICFLTKQGIIPNQIVNIALYDGVHLIHWVYKQEVYHLKRVLQIILKVLFNVYSPFLKQKVRISDIRGSRSWK